MCTSTNKSSQTYRKKVSYAHFNCIPTHKIMSVPQIQKCLINYRKIMTNWHFLKMITIAQNQRVKKKIYSSSMITYVSISVIYSKAIWINSICLVHIIKLYLYITILSDFIISKISKLKFKLIFYVSF